jgi:hypothetical protein
MSSTSPISADVLALAWGPEARLVIWHIQCLSVESSHWYNIMVKSTKYLQFWYFSHNYSNLRPSTTRISTWRISTLAQNLYDIKNKHQSSQVKPVLNIPNNYIITLCIALQPLLITLHIDFPLLGIVSDLLHFYIFVLLIAFSYAMCLRKY